MNHRIQEAAALLNTATTLLMTARNHLLLAKNSLHEPLGRQISKIEEIRLALIDSEGVETE